MTVANTVNATDVRIGQCMRDMIEFVMRHASSSAARSLGLSGIDFFNWPDVARVAPGPYLLQQSGKPFTRKEFARQFAEARDAIPELKKLTLHGLRATAVINLRRAGLRSRRSATSSGRARSWSNIIAATPTCARTAAPR
jgi:hypothetical protein